MKIKINDFLKLIFILFISMTSSSDLFCQGINNSGNGTIKLKYAKNQKSSNCIIKTIPSPTSGTSSMAFDGQYLWVGAYNENLIYKIDTTGYVLKTINTSIIRPYGLAFENSDLWISDRDNHILQKVDTINGTVLSTIPTPDVAGWPSGIEWDGNNLWYNESLYDTTYVLDTIGTVVNKYKSFGNNPFALSFQNNYLWSSNTIVGEVYKIDTTNFTVVDTITAPGGAYPTGMAFDGQNLWIASNSSDSIYKMCFNEPCISNTGEDSIAVCDSYTWIDGITYTTSNNTATHILNNASGCDSVVTLNLTVSFSNTGTHIQTACDSYTWIDGNTYTASNSTTTHTLTNSPGCDSVVTLNLTMNFSTTGTDVQTVCDTYTWIDGNTYTASNSTATHTLTNSVGCDSAVTLNLIINNIDSSVTQQGTLLTADETGATYQWLNCPSMTPISGATSQSYTATANRDYAVIVANNGCSDTSSCYTVTGVGIIENDFGIGLLIYPNPTDGGFSIDLGDQYQSVAITMMDLSGKLILNNSFNKSQLLNFKIEEPAGVYLLVIESGDKKAVIRLIKE